MNSIFERTKYFLLLTLVFITIMIIMLLSFSKSEIHLAINKAHLPLFDSLFLLSTRIGDGYFGLVLIALFLPYSTRYFAIMLSSFVITGCIVGFIKRAFFYGEPRPLTYFEGISNLYIVPGLEPNEINSFPSGHTAIAFALFLCMAFVFKRPVYSAVFFTIGALVAYSRMYLSEHFMIDVLAGCIIGVGVSILVLFVFEKYSMGKYLHLNGSISAS